MVDFGIIVLRDGRIVLYNVHNAFDEMTVKVRLIFCTSFPANVHPFL